MEITSVGFLLFLAVSLMIYWHAPKNVQWIVLLIDSLFYYFINTSAAYTFIYLSVSVITVYIATRNFETENDEKKKKIILVGTLIVNIGILAVLKYTNLVISTINIFKICEPISLVRWISPIAISFYTLQIVAYLLDAYWGVTDIEHNPFKLLLFTSYFPLMVSGPISRHTDLAHQFWEEHRFDYDEVTCGIRRIAWGWAKKLIVADRLAYPVSYMFENTDIFSGIWVLIAGALFVVELYFDFSGCMDIIIGASACFGIKLQENFRAPFLSRTVQEFWQRWHISLGGWLKNYVMYPLLKTELFLSIGQWGKQRFGKQGKKIPSYIAMFVVWTLTGLWHGNSWKYIIGVGWWFWSVIVLGQLLEPWFIQLKQKLHINDSNSIWRVFQIIRTWVVFTIGNIFFQADSLLTALRMLQKIFVSSKWIQALLELKGVFAIATSKGLLHMVGMLIIFALQCVVDYKLDKGQAVQTIIKSKPFWMRWMGYYILIYLILLCGSMGQGEFIYRAF